MADVVLTEVSDRIATVTLNRPESRNALNREVRRTLPKAIGEADADEGVDVIILTGADPAFCAGIDLKELGAGGGGALTGGDEGDPVLRTPFPPTTKPVIGAINGVAVTGGFELALNCDFLIASDRARFADTHARVGIQPGWGLTVLLPQAVGVRRARELSATGNFLDAETALAWGLVNHVVAHDELLPFCRKLASRHRLERPGGRAPDPPDLRGGLARRARATRGRSRPRPPGTGRRRTSTRPKSSDAARASSTAAVRRSASQLVS